MFARRTYRVFGLAAATWCAAFGLLSLYWAAGGTLGVDQLAVSLQERADEREPGFVALVAATGIAKLVGAIVPLWLVFRPPAGTARKILLFLCWAGGGGPGRVRAHRCSRRVDPRRPGHDGKRDLVCGAVGPDLAAWRVAVSDDGLEVSGGAEARRTGMTFISAKRAARPPVSRRVKHTSRRAHLLWT
jgi:hypothetical protein